MTKIFKTRSEFIGREDKEINGVDEYFAKNNPNWENENKTNKGCWNCSDCSRCSGCSRCYDCSDCSGCFGCSRLKNKKSQDKAFEIPKIKNIHQTIYKAVSEPNALNMSDWHTCDTTHCRAGWIVTLAGEEGKTLETKTSTLFAAMQIYKASSTIRVFPPRFFDGDKKAMEDMKRCAEEESTKEMNVNE